MSRWARPSLVLGVCLLLVPLLAFVQHPCIFTEPCITRFLLFVKLNLYSVLVKTSIEVSMTMDTTTLGMQITQVSLHHSVTPTDLEFGDDR